MNKRFPDTVSECADRGRCEALHCDRAGCQKEAENLAPFSIAHGCTAVDVLMSGILQYNARH